MSAQCAVVGCLIRHLQGGSTAATLDTVMSSGFLRKVLRVSLSVAIFLGIYVTLFGNNM